MRKRNLALVLGAVLVFASLGAALWWRPRPEIHVLHDDGPIIVARTLSATEVRQILRVVHHAMQDADVSALRGFGLPAVRSVVNRHLFEQIYDLEIERDGSVTVLTRNQRRRPPQSVEPGTPSGYSGYGRSFRLVKGTNEWEIRGHQSWTMGSPNVTIAY